MVSLPARPRGAAAAALGLDVGVCVRHGPAQVRIQELVLSVLPLKYFSFIHLNNILYQLLQKHLLICRTKLHYIDFNGPLLSLSHIDI